MADDYANPFDAAPRQPVQQPGANGGGLNVRSGYSGGNGYGAGGYGSGGTGGAGNMSPSSMSWGAQGAGNAYGNPWQQVPSRIMGGGGMGYGGGYGNPWGQQGGPMGAAYGAINANPAQWAGQSPQTQQAYLYAARNQQMQQQQQQAGGNFYGGQGGPGVTVPGGGIGAPLMQQPQQGLQPMQPPGNPWGGQSGAPNIWGAAGQPGAGNAYGNPWQARL